MGRRPGPVDGVDKHKKKVLSDDVDIATPTHEHVHTRPDPHADAWGPQRAAGGASAIPVTGLVDGGAAPVIRRDLTDLLSYVPAAPEWLKEKIDPRRATANPYWQKHNKGEHDAEANLPTYHSTSRHGAENTLANLEERKTKQVGAPKLSEMVNPVTGKKDVPKAKDSSRFATPAWHMYALNVAKREFTKQVGKGAFAWPKNGDPGVPKYKGPGVMDANFFVTFTKNIVGLTVKNGGGDGDKADTIKVAVNYTLDPAGNPSNAIIGQLFPVTAAGAAKNGFANVAIPYAEVPWFSTDA